MICKARPAMRIADEYLQSSVYIYPDEASAKAGKWAGGSGFFVHSEWMDGEKNSTADFVVTNRHVLKNIVDRDTKKPADPIVRLNRRDPYHLVVGLALGLHLGIPYRFMVVAISA